MMASSAARDASPAGANQQRVSLGTPRIAASFFIALAILLGITAFAYVSVRQVRESIERRDHTFVVLHAADDILRGIRDAEAAQRGYLLAGSAEYLAGYDAAIASLGSTLLELRGLVRDTSQVQRLDAIEALVAERVDRFATVLERRRLAGVTTQEVIRDIGVGRETMDRLVRLVVDFERSERDILAARDRPLQHGLEQLVIAVGLGGLLTVALSALAAWQIHRGARRQLRLQEEVVEVAENARKLTRELNVELESQARNLQLANRELEAFSYTVSHDLRAPLRHVQGYIDLLNRSFPTPPTGKSERYLRTIGEAAAEMGQLIDDLLAFSQTGRAEMHATDVSLDAMVATVIAGLEMSTRDRHIEWQIAPLPTVRADPPLLKQVWANLIGNAVKYSNMRDPATIEIGVTKQGDGLRRALRARQRRGLRHAARRQALRRLPAPAPRRRVRGHRHRPCHGPAHRHAPRRRDPRAGAAGPRRDLLFFPSPAPRPWLIASACCTSRTTRSTPS